jgi:hypothetical protein
MKHDVKKATTSSTSNLSSNFELPRYIYLDMERRSYNIVFSQVHIIISLASFLPSLYTLFVKREGK